MLEEMAFTYYKEDADVSDSLFATIKECEQRAKGILKKTVVNILTEKDSFHDAYLSVINIQSDNGVTQCKMGLSHLGILYTIYFNGVSSFHVKNDIVSPDAEYPKSENESSMAQVLDIWFDYHDELECCILLDSERFVLIKTQNVWIEVNNL